MVEREPISLPSSAPDIVGGFGQLLGLEVFWIWSQHLDRLIIIKFAAPIYPSCRSTLERETGCQASRRRRQFRFSACHLCETFSCLERPSWHHLHLRKAHQVTPNPTATS